MSIVIAHKEHEAQCAHEAEAEGAHAQGDGGGEGAVEPEVGFYAEEGEGEEQEGAGDCEEVAWVAEDGGQVLDVGEAHGFSYPGVVA